MNEVSVKSCVLNSCPLRQNFAHTSCSIIELGQGLVTHLLRSAKTSKQMGSFKMYFKVWIPTTASCILQSEELLI